MWGFPAEIRRWHGLTEHDSCAKYRTNKISLPSKSWYCSHLYLSATLIPSRPVSILATYSWFWGCGWDQGETNSKIRKTIVFDQFSIRRGGPLPYWAIPWKFTSQLWIAIDIECICPSAQFLPGKNVFHTVSRFGSPLWTDKCWM